MFSQSPANHSRSGPFIIVSEVESTNNYAMAKLHAGLLEQGSCFLTHQQTAGKGQRGKTWSSAPGQNITMSTVFKAQTQASREKLQVAATLLSQYPFLLSAQMALSCYDFIKGFGIENVSIKWPNDVYIDDRKAAGILIENLYLGNRWSAAVVGTGVNVNQEVFEFGAPAASIRLSTGRSYTIEAEARGLHALLRDRFEQLGSMESSAILSAYNACLYRRGSRVRLKQGAIQFETVVKEVSLGGQLITEDAMERRFNVGEVVFQPIG